MFISNQQVNNFSSSIHPNILFSYVHVLWIANTTLSSWLFIHYLVINVIKVVSVIIGRIFNLFWVINDHKIIKKLS